MAFISQTGLYLLTLYPFLRFVQKRFLFILQNIPKPASKLLLAESLVWFLTMIVINYTFVQDYRYPFFEGHLPLGARGQRGGELYLHPNHCGRPAPHRETPGIVYIDGLTGPEKTGPAFTSTVRTGSSRANLSF